MVWSDTIWGIAHRYYDGWGHYGRDGERIEVWTLHLGRRQWTLRRRHTPLPDRKEA